ncbi:MAG: hypothetical protein EOO38_04455 [Cytophagaceae bacterium]|nr:MAG: hypothetical protein EOO38_04455 [Cytophagaceae bacterium]
MHTYSFGDHYPLGRAFLVPRPLEEIRVVLESKPIWFKGFERQGDRSQNLSAYDLESTWTQVYYQYHPQAYRNDKLARLKRLDSVLAKGGITVDERRDWGEAIAAETTAEASSKLANIPAETVLREEFNRHTVGATGVTRNKFNTIEYVVLLDVAPFLDHQGPLTLVWHGGEKTTWERTSFEWFSCMTGVTCFVAPHWKTVAKEEEFLSLEVRTSLADMARKFDALSDNEVHRLYQVLDVKARLAVQSNDVRQKGKMEVPFRWPKSELVDLKFRILSGSLEARDAEQPIKALADGRFFSVIGSAKPGGQVLMRTDAGVRAQAVSTSVRVDSTRVDGNGQLWGLTSEQDEQQLKTICLVRLEANRLVMRKENRCIKNGLDPDWMMTSKGHALLYAPYVSALDAPKTRWIDLMSDRGAVAAEPFFQSREEAMDVTPPMANRWASTDGETMDLGDGLFWFGRKGLVGVSPETGRAIKSFPGVNETRVAGPLVFGSIAGNWVLQTTTASNYSQVLRVYRLTDGLPLYDLPSDLNIAASARSAHGRLLAYARGGFKETNSILVWDMTTGAPVASIAKPIDADVLSIAFNWRGDELWIQALDRSTARQGVMIWQIPNALKDPADSLNVPDQSVSGIGQRWKR